MEKEACPVQRRTESALSRAERSDNRSIRRGESPERARNPNPTSTLGPRARCTKVLLFTLGNHILVFCMTEEKKEEKPEEKEEKEEVKEEKPEEKKPE